MAQFVDYLYIVFAKLKMLLEDQVIIFLHIPKAAGITFYQILNRQYSKEFVLCLDGTRFHESMEALINESTQIKEKIQVIEGHMYFGMHKYLKKKATYLTMLRHPIERAISTYGYILENPKHYLHTEVIQQKMSLKEFTVSKLSGEIDNCQTRLISGIDTQQACNEEMLAIAKRNIKDFFLVAGLVEQFDESILLISQLLNWKTPIYQKANKTRRPLNKEEISQDIIDEIAAVNCFDMELYSYAEELFNRTIEMQGKEFEETVKKFKGLNSRYQKIDQIKTGFRSFYCKFTSQ